jgi:hypothetical protein
VKFARLRMLSYNLLSETSSKTPLQEACIKAEICTRWFRSGCVDWSLAKACATIDDGANPGITVMCHTENFG